MTRISVQLDLSEDQRSRISAAAEECDLVWDGTFQRCDVVFGNPEPEELPQAADLRWVQLESVGFGEYLDLDWTTLRGRLTLTNLTGFFADPVAETALAGILALGRGIDRLVRHQTAGHWVGDPIREDLRLLRDAHVVVLGYGAINRRLAELLVPFGCKITQFDSAATPQTIDAALPAADILVAAVPDTPATRNLMNDQRLGLLPPHAVFVNLGRGSLVDEAALADALLSNRLGGAVLDVTNDEPLPMGHAFWTCPNTILTQHSGGGTTDELDRKIDYFLSNLTRYRAGQPLTGTIDLTRGY
ncbi:MAG: D-2-hydroxyacid dehydrogenase [Sulfitobacter sp.]